MSIKASLNIINFTDEVSDLRNACRLLCQLIDGRRYPEIILDFSECELVFEKFMLPMVARIRYYQECKNISFTLVAPKDRKLEGLFINTNWAYYIDEKQYAINEDAKDDFLHIPTHNYRDVQALDKVVAGILHVLIGKLEGLDKNSWGALEWVLNEVADNVLNHAQSRVGGFIQATTYGQNKAVEFIIADAGIGIPKSMKVEGKHADEEIIQRAIKKGETGNKIKGQGNGLYGAWQLAAVSGGQFEINSYHGHLLAEGKKVDIKNFKIPYDGTFVRCRIKYDDPRLLSKALQIGEKPHQPHSIFIEQTYATDKDGEMIISIKDKYARTRSREGGRDMRTEIKNLLESGNKIIIDFEGVNVISSSFADEVFGRLFVELGPVGYSNRIQLRNIDQMTHGLIDLAIQQRFLTENGNK